MSKEETSQQQVDQRFQRMRLPDRFGCPMCDKCGLCCLGRDWSTEWMGQRVGICGNLNIKTGECIDEQKKSIICRNHVCEKIEDFIKRIIYILSRDCPTATAMVVETIGRKISNFTVEEQEYLMEILKRKDFRGPERVPC